MKLFDAHSHIIPPDALERAAQAGVAGIALCGTSPNDWPQLFQTLENFDFAFPNLGKDKFALTLSVGIHPWFVGCRAGSVTPPDSAPKLRGGYSWVDDFQTLEKLLRDFPNLGIGETGLDFQERFENRSEQEKCFIAHLDLARELDRPVTVHCVKAWGKMLEILREYPQPKKILHAFSGSAELIPELTKLNGWFSFGPAVLNPKHKRVKASVAAVPDELLLIETDSEQEPMPLLPIARAVAELRGVSVEEIAELTFANAQSVFGLPKNSSAMTAHSRPKGR